MDGPALRSKYLEFAKASKVLDRSDCRELAKLTVIGSDFLTHRAEALVADAAGRPILCSFGSDGTNLLSRKTFSFEIGSQKRHREAGSATEFLIQKAFFKTVAHSPGPLMAIVLKPPVPL